MKLSADVAHKSQQCKWQQDTTGHCTRQLIPNVAIKQNFPDFGVFYYTRRLLLNDAMLNDKNYRTGTADYPMCDCGMEGESTEQFILKCGRYEKAMR